MGEIKFTTERMREVHNRIDEMITQLNSACNSSADQLGTISGNIKSDNMSSTLNSYKDTMIQTCSDTVNNLKALDEYLVGKIGTYTAIDQAGVESMSEVQSLLSQLDS